MKSLTRREGSGDNLLSFRPSYFFTVALVSASLGNYREHYGSEEPID